VKTFNLSCGYNRELMLGNTTEYIVSMCAVINRPAAIYGELALVGLKRESATWRQAVEIWNERHYTAASCGELTLVPRERD